MSNAFASLKSSLSFLEANILDLCSLFSFSCAGHLWGSFAKVFSTLTKKDPFALPTPMYLLPPHSSKYASSKTKCKKQNKDGAIKQHKMRRFRFGNEETIYSCSLECHDCSRWVLNRVKNLLSLLILTYYTFNWEGYSSLSGLFLIMYFCQKKVVPYL